MKSLSPAEILTLVISGFALLLSIISTVLSHRVQTRQLTGSLYEQLSSVISKLSVSIAEYRELGAIQSENPTTRFLRLNTLTGSIRLLSRQAVHLDQNSPDLITDTECTVLAEAHALVSDFGLAHLYWKKAIDRSASAHYEVVNRRGYANFLFQHGYSESARAEFTRSLALLSNDSDPNKFVNAYTYQVWMINEINIGFKDAAEQYYLHAKNLYESIADVNLKRESLAHLEGLREYYKTVPES